MLSKHSLAPFNRTWTWVLFVALIYFILARLSLLLAFEHSNATPIWPPSGFALAMIILIGRRIVPGIALGAFAANLLVFITNGTSSLTEALLVSSCIAAGNATEALTGNYLLKKLIPSGSKSSYFKKVNQLLRFVLAAILMCFTSATIGTGAVWSAGIISSVEFSYVWLTWLTGDLSGILLFTPLIVVWATNPKVNLKRKDLVELGAHIITVILFSGVIFFDWFFSSEIFNWVFWMVPVLVWAALRFRTREMLTAMVLFAILAIWGTATNHGAFSNIPVNNGLLIVQAFVSIMMVTKLALNASINQQMDAMASLNEMHNKLEARIVERTAQLRHEKEFVETLFNSIEDPMAVFDTKGRYIMVNSKTEELYQVKKSDFEGKYILELFPTADQSTFPYLEKALRGETILNLTFFSEITGKYFENHYIPLKRQEDGVYGVLVIGHDITESRKMEIKFRGLVESSPDATVFINLEGNIVLVNSQLEILFGYERQELEGKEIQLLIPHRYHETYLKKRDSFAAAPKSRTLGSGVELFGRKKDGTEFAIEVSLSPIETEEGLWISGSIRDITNRKKAEVEIKKINLQLIEAQRLAHIGSWEWDVVTNVLTWSDEMYRIFGTTSEKFDLNFDNFLNAIHPEDRKSVMDNIQSSIKKQEPFDIYYRIVRPDGQERILQRRGEVLVNDQGKAIKLKGTTQDVTEMKLAEALLRAKTEELVVLNYSLHASNRELHRMNADLSTFAYVASHDLQEPLRKIQTFAARILETEMQNLSENGRDFLHRMHKSVRRVHVLLEDLLTYSRLNTSEKVFERTDLNKIMEEEKEELHELLLEKKATIDFVTLPQIHAIPFQMRQLFHNLIINSLKFSDPLRQPHIQIRSVETDRAALPDNEFSTALEYHCISFSDNGIGFEPRFNERIFEVFQRLHVNSSYPGTGIGLAICKKIAENHGGKIIAEGEPDKGATFHIYLPANSN